MGIRRQKERGKELVPVLPLRVIGIFGHFIEYFVIFNKPTASSCRPIAVDAKDIMELFEALTRTEVHIANIIDDCICIAFNLASTFY